MPHTKTKFFSIQTLKPSIFRPPHKKQVNSDPHTEIKSISTTHTNTKSISMLTLKPASKTESISTTHTKTKSIDHHNKTYR